MTFRQLEFSRGIWTTYILLGDHTGTEPGQIKSVVTNVKRKYDNGEKHQNHVLGNSTGKGNRGEIREVGSE